MRPLYSATRAVLIALAVGLAWGPPARSQTPPIPTLPARPPADTDSIRRPPPGTTTIPGLELPLELNLRVEGKKERDRNLGVHLARGDPDERDLGMQRGFSAVVAPTYREHQERRDRRRSLARKRRLRHAARVRRVQRALAVLRRDAGLALAARRRRQRGLHAPAVAIPVAQACPPETTAYRSPTSSARCAFNRFSRNRGATSARRASSRSATSARQANGRDIDDYQVERLRFFFTVDPALLGGGRAFPNIDILNRSQLRALRASLPDTLRPTLVRIYRLQFGTQPQNPSGPRFRVRGGQTNGTAVYDLLREGVDYVIDGSLLWFALVRPLNETNERLVVAYNVRINGRDTVWASTGGTPDLQHVPGRDQVANLVMDPTVGPTSAAFRNEIRSAYLVAGSNLARETATIRIVTGSGRLEHPIAGRDATFLEMFGLSQAANPAEFDAENRIWPRRSDAVFNLGAGAVDIRNGQSLNPSFAIHDYFLVFPSLHPFSARDSGLVVPGNPTNDDIYTIPGRIHLLAAAPVFAVPHERPLSDGEPGASGRRRGGDQHRGGIDPARLGAGRDGRAAIGSRPRLPHRLRHRPHGVHAAGHAALDAAARRRSLRREPVVRFGADDARRVHVRAAGVATARSTFWRSTSRRARPSRAPSSGCRATRRSRPA